MRTYEMQARRKILWRHNAQTVDLKEQKTTKLKTKDKINHKKYHLEKRYEILSTVWRQTLDV